MSQLAGIAAAARPGDPSPDDTSRMGGEWLPTLADVPLFQGLSKRHLKRVASLARTRRFADGSPIVRAGEPGSTFYVLIDGGARVMTPKGRAKRLRAGDFFGEMSLFDDSPRSASVVADGAVLTMTINRSAFGKLLRSEPALAQQLLRTLATRLRAAEKTV